jgi:DNA-binding CsgD family transcriptional regulator
MPADVLTRTEQRVLRMAASGMPAKVIARDLGISDQTVKNHHTNIHRKLDVDTLVGAMIMMGWVRIPNTPLPTYTQCQYVGQCGRPDQHRGHHGGFRGIAFQEQA